MSDMELDEILEQLDEGLEAVREASSSLEEGQKEGDLARIPAVRDAYASLMQAERDLATLWLDLQGEKFDPEELKDPAEN